MSVRTPLVFSPGQQLTPVQLSTADILDPNSFVTGAAAGDRLIYDGFSWAWKNELVAELSAVSSIAGTSLANNITLNLPRAGTYTFYATIIFERLTGTSTVSVGWACTNSSRYLWAGYAGNNSLTTVVQGAGNGTTTAAGSIVSSSSASAVAMQAMFQGSVTVTAASVLSIQGARSTGTAQFRAGSSLTSLQA